MAGAGVVTGYCVRKGRRVCLLHSASRCEPSHWQAALDERVSASSGVVSKIEGASSDVAS
jgi:hypothetical protein